MAKRWIGDALVRVRYSKENDSYDGSVTVRSLGITWRFVNLPVSDKLLVEAHGRHVGRTSEEAIDTMAGIAVMIGSALRSEDDENEDEVVRAAAIEEATKDTVDECGEYEVRRTR